MKFNGYKLIGYVCAFLSIISSWSATYSQFKGTTGIGLKNVSPATHYVIKKAGCYAEPARCVINEVANQYWLSNVGENAEKTYRVGNHAIKDAESNLGKDNDYVLVDLY